jgi:hypothetical protein
VFLFSRRLCYKHETSFQRKKVLRSLNEALVREIDILKSQSGKGKLHRKRKIVSMVKREKRFQLSLAQKALGEFLPPRKNFIHPEAMKTVKFLMCKFVPYAHFHCRFIVEFSLWRE